MVWNVLEEGSGRWKAESRDVSVELSSIRSTGPGAISLDEMSRDSA